jgi:hypothetical protein
MSPAAVYVGRPTIWGNPWVVSAALPPLEAVARYRALLDADANLRARARRELAGHDLVCWCRPSQPCHADVLLEVANGPPTPARPGRGTPAGPQQQG